MAPKKTVGKPNGRRKPAAKSKRTKEHRWTNKEKVFIDTYLRTLNGAQAAREAGYSEHSIYEIAYENLRKPHIRAEIERRLAEVQMSSAEVLARLAAIASASQRPFVKVTKDGAVYYDFSQPGAMEHLHLIKAINTKRTRRVIGKGENAEEWEDEWVRVELNDPQHALELLGKYHKLWFEKEEALAFNLQIDFSKLSIEQVKAIKDAKTREEVIAIITDPGTGGSGA